MNELLRGTLINDVTTIGHSLCSHHKGHRSPLLIGASEIVEAPLAEAVT